MNIEWTTIGSFLGYASIIIQILDKAINHKRCRSRCCGYKADISLDIDQTPITERLQSVDSSQKIDHLKINIPDKK